MFTNQHADQIVKVSSSKAVSSPRRRLTQVSVSEQIRKAFTLSYASSQIEKVAKCYVLQFAKKTIQDNLS